MSRPAKRHRERLRFQTPARRTPRRSPRVRLRLGPRGFLAALLVVETDELDARAEAARGTSRSASCTRTSRGSSGSKLRLHTGTRARSNRARPAVGLGRAACDSAPRRARDLPRSLISAAARAARCARRSSCARRRRAISPPRPRRLPRSSALEHAHHVAAELERTRERVGELAPAAGLDVELRDRQLDVVLLEPIEPRPRGRSASDAVDAQRLRSRDSTPSPRAPCSSPCGRSRAARAARCACRDSAS